MIEENKDFLIIDFTGLFSELIRKLWIIILAGAIGAGGAWVYANQAIANEQSVPMYKSTVKLYVTGSETVIPSANAKILGQSFFEDYCEIMKSSKVTSYVIDNLSLNISKSQLVSCISTRWITNTCMAYVTVTFPDAQFAKAIVDELVRVTSAYALEIIGMTPPTVYEESIVATQAVYFASVNTTKYIIIGFAGGVMVALLGIVVFFFSDRKVRSPKQIMEKTNVPIYATFLNTKSVQADLYNNLGASRLHENLFLRHRTAQVIGFFISEKENNYSTICQYGCYLKACNKKIVIVDTRLACPENDEGDGLLNYLTGDTDSIASIVYEKDGFDQISCSQAVRNSMEYLDGGRFTELINKLKEQYDYVLLNTASIEKTSEALVVKEKTDVNLFVAECGKTTYPACKDYMKKYNDGECFSGIVLSNVKGNVKGKRFKKLFGYYFGMS